MKNLHYYIVFVMLLLVSCSMDDIKKVSPGREIEFRVLSTKGSVVDMGKFQKFTVVALKEDGTEYYIDEYEWNGLGYTSAENKTHMWPTDGTKLFFYAYSQYGSEPSGELTLQSGDLNLEGFSPAADITSQVDFICATAQGDKTVDVVDLKFAHKLAQIEIKALNSNPCYVCKVAGVRIANALSCATYDFVAGEWEFTGTKSVHDVFYGSPVVLTDAGVSLMKHEGDNALLIPQTLSPWQLDEANDAKGVYVALLVRITTADGAIVYPLVDNPDVPFAGFDWAALPLDGSWDPGLKYTYKWDIPTVGGYVYPGKPTPEISIVDNFVSGSHIMGEQISFLTPVLDDYSL